MEHITLNPSNLNLFIFSFACYLGMVMAGISITWTAPLTAWFKSEKSEVPMSKEEVSWMVSIVAIGAGVASIPCGMLADIFGRKMILLGMGITSLMGWILIMITRSKWVLYVAQFLGGIVLGGVPTVAPVYISEISPPHIRGAIVGQLNTMINLSLLIVYFIGPLLTYTHYIRVCSSIPILFFICFGFAPESPYYLMTKGRDEEAKECMTKLRGKDSLAELELAKKEALKNKSTEKASIWQVLKTNNYMKHMIYLQILSWVSMSNGVSSLSAYASEFLGGQLVAVEMAAVSVVSSFFAAFLADPLGRRPLLVSSLIGAAIFTSVLATYFICREKILLYIGLFGFCFITSVGINPFMMTLPSELFPTSLRGLANGLTSLTSGFSAFISIKTFVDINERLGIQYNLFIYTVISLSGALLGYLLPETAKSVISAC